MTIVVPHKLSRMFCITLVKKKKTGKPKTQPETTSHPKHIVQTRDNNNICKSIKRKEAKQGKLHKPPIANSPKKKLATKSPPYKETANQHSAYNTDTFTYNADTQK